MTDIRPARPDDAAAIAGLLNPILRETTISFTSQEKTVAEIAETISEHNDNDWPFFVAMADHVIGVASYAPFRKGPGYARTMEHTIYLDPNHFGAGLGAQLMDALEAHARGHDVTTLIAGISGENPRAVAFHAKLGFIQTGHLPGIGHKFGRNLDLILMQKALVSPARDGP